MWIVWTPLLFIAFLLTLSIRAYSLQRKIVREPKRGAAAGGEGGGSATTSVAGSPTTAETNANANGSGAAEAEVDAESPTETKSANGLTTAVGSEEGEEEVVNDGEPVLAGATQTSTSAPAPAPTIARPAEGGSSLDEKRDEHV